jgi:hypothetical protein
MANEKTIRRIRFLSIWKLSPLDYKYIEAGQEPGGHIALVVALADGYDREELKGLIYRLSVEHTRKYLRRGSGPVIKEGEQVHNNYPCTLPDL